MNPGDRLVVDIEKINSEGEGIARVGESGFVVFIPFALPGERVECGIVRSSKKYAAGKVLKIISASPDRVEPKCSVYGRCGGCQLQHVRYDAQLAIKAEILRDALRRIGGFSGIEVKTCRPSPSEWRYRGKTSLPVSKQGDSFSWGYYAARSHNVVPFDSCPVLDESLESLVRNAANLLKRKKVTGYDERKADGDLRYIVARKGDGGLLLGLVTSKEESHRELGHFQAVGGDLMHAIADLRGVVLNLNPQQGNFVWGPRFRTLAGKNYIREKMSNYDFELDISSFFQINREQAENLFAHASGEALKGRPGKILELYSGVGGLTAFLAAGASRVVAVEERRSAAKYLEDNMASNGLNNVEVVADSAEKAVGRVLDDRFDSVVLDPPRGGCERTVIGDIARAGILRVVYVSCNPATLARDAKIFAESGYVIESIKAFDMFPQTAQVETCCVLSKK